jgi:hypothetical protein
MGADSHASFSLSVGLSLNELRRAIKLTQLHTSFCCRPALRLPLMAFWVSHSLWVALDLVKHDAVLGFGVGRNPYQFDLLAFRKMKFVELEIQVANHRPNA